MNQQDNVKAWFLKKCENLKITMTKPRQVILDVLLESDDHPDVEMIHQRASKKDRRISVATCYRALNLFQEHNLIARHDFGDGRARYEMAPRQHHDHLIDIETGDVIEFRNDMIEKLQVEVAETLGYELTGHRLELYGHKKK